jgi:hypothetical protein
MFLRFHETLETAHASTYCCFCAKYYQNKNTEISEEIVLEKRGVKYISWPHAMDQVTLQVSPGDSSVLNREVR